MRALRFAHIAGTEVQLLSFGWKAIGGAYGTQVVTAAARPVKGRQTFSWKKKDRKELRSKYQSTKPPICLFYRHYSY